MTAVDPWMVQRGSHDEDQAEGEEQGAGEGGAASPAIQNWAKMSQVRGPPTPPPTSSHVVGIVTYMN